MRYKKHALTAAMVMVMAGSITLPDAYAGNRDRNRDRDRDIEITLIHMGDLHGHTIPRPNLRSDGDGRMEGGLARMYTKIKEIRADSQYSLLINTGDTTQGSGEALYTRGKALVDVVDLFGVDAFAAGNWEFVYGPERFKEFFADHGDGNRWGALASNLYNTATDVDANGDINGSSVDTSVFSSGKIPATLSRVHTQDQYDAWSTWYIDNGERILPPFSIKQFDGIKVGIIGCTTRRGPQVVGSWVVDGIEFTNCAKEVAHYAKMLRDPEGDHKVDLVVLVTEIEVGVNIEMVHTMLGDAEHVDVILNSDMHEETLDPIQITNKDGVKETLLIEEGQDGTMIGQLKLTFNDAGLKKWKFKPHRIHDGIREDKKVAKKVAEVRAPFTTDFDSCAANTECRENYHKNSFSGTYLTGSLDDVVGTTEVGLHRSNYSDEYSDEPGNEMRPAVLEGTSHDFIADAIRWWAGSDIATVRGFRYGTHVKQGPITRNDLYHFIPIGARVGKASRIHVGQIRNQVDNSSQAVFSSDPISALVRSAPYNNNGWGGGWLFAYSGDNFSVDFAPYAFRQSPVSSRARNLQVDMPCDRVPGAVDGCSGKATTTITNGTNGGFMPDWGATLTDENGDPAPVTTYALQTDPPIAPGQTWGFKPGTATKQNQLPVLQVAGYWYEQSPFKLNNCPNCNPLGTSNDDNNAEAPYILPVNEDPDTGGPMLDGDGKPVLQRDADGNIIRGDENRPLAAGNPIELVTVIEKYLDHLMATTGKGANPTPNRISLWNGKMLPGRDVFGHPVMQPLCGTIPETQVFTDGRDPANLDQTTDETDYSTFQCWKDSKIISVPTP